MHFNQEQIDFFRTNGYLLGPRVLSDEQIKELKNRIQGVLDGSVSFPQLYKGETVDRSKAKGQLPSVKIVNLHRHDTTFALSLIHISEPTRPY